MGYQAACSSVSYTSYLKFPLQKVSIYEKYCCDLKRQIHCKESEAPIYSLKIVRLLDTCQGFLKTNPETHVTFLLLREHFDILLKIYVPSLVEDIFNITGQWKNYSSGALVESQPKSGTEYIYVFFFSPLHAGFFVCTGKLGRCRCT